MPIRIEEGHAGPTQAEWGREGVGQALEFE